MIQIAVLPFGRPGIISAAMLGLGRALGETMAVAMVLSPAVAITLRAAPARATRRRSPRNIALNFPEAHGIGVNVLIATGLILFLITLAINSVGPVRGQPPQGLLGSELMTHRAPHGGIANSLTTGTPAQVGAVGAPRRQLRVVMGIVFALIAMRTAAASSTSAGPSAARHGAVRRR